ncbi:MAG: LacI family transcriptional regulator [Ruminococcaceae bacterium]|nr:LacI family transcriptional regulator [Oscillospiraceae bacterium]
MKGNSTLKYIAQQMGISVSTVSRALNEKSVVKEETRKKVQEMAKKYGYVPNEVARSLQKSSTETIAVVLPDISETFFARIVKGLENVMMQHGYMIILADTRERADKESQYIEMLYRRRVDALVLATVDCSGASATPFLESGTPVVFIDNIPDIVSADVITVDNIAASKVATKYLLSAGHQKIAVILGSKTETTGIERLEGYRQALYASGEEVDEELIEYGDYKMESGYEAMKRLLEKRRETAFSAVYVTSEKMTYGAIRAIREAGLTIPGDLSLVGFDIHNLMDDRPQMITTVCQPEEAIGKKVGELLLDRLKNEENGQKGIKMRLSPFIYEGDTVKRIHETESKYC